MGTIVLVTYSYLHQEACSFNERCQGRCQGQWRGGIIQSDRAEKHRSKPRVWAVYEGREPYEQRLGDRRAWSGFGHKVSYSTGIQRTSLCGKNSSSGPIASFHFLHVALKERQCLYLASPLPSPRFVMALWQTDDVENPLIWLPSVIRFSCPICSSFSNLFDSMKSFQKEETL